MKDKLLELNEDEWKTYVQLTARAIELPIPESSMPGVIKTLMTTASVARPLLEIDLPEGTELGPVFRS